MFCQGPQKKKKKSADNTEEVSTHLFILYCIIKDQSILIILFKVSPGNKVSAKKVRSAEQLILLILTIFADHVLLTKECGQHWRGEHPFVYFVLYYRGSKYPHKRSAKQLILLILTIFADHVLLTKECGRHWRGEHPFVYFVLYYQRFKVSS